MRMKRSTATIALACSFLLVPLAGCSSGSDDAPSPEPGIETRTPVDLPSEFPADFPLVDGDLVAASPLGESGWTATVAVEDSDAMDSALEALETDGYTVHGHTDEESGVRTYSLNNGTLGVTLTLSSANNEFLVSYSFAPMNVQ
jgi:hypothetical protein